MPKGNELGVPVILDTDAKSKCEKYRHLGMELAGVRRFGVTEWLYDLIKYRTGKRPEAMPMKITMLAILLMMLAILSGVVRRSGIHPEQALFWLCAAGKSGCDSG